MVRGLLSKFLMGGKNLSRCPLKCSRSDIQKGFKFAFPEFSHEKWLNPACRLEYFESIAHFY